ncbi:hypothetical protein F2Q69_00030309 [Brassica cretica]|uniref:Uncharacterized protein n=1 Tax=Brassica cretica TaxID=69181 RepID=A0A8S9RZV9_BRACR|nr:hypothetical protein F2Q69_00030309 [Brassica cretica]
MRTEPGHEDMMMGSTLETVYRMTMQSDIHIGRSTMMAIGLRYLNLFWELRVKREGSEVSHTVTGETYPPATAKGTKQRWSAREIKGCKREKPNLINFSLAHLSQLSSSCRQLTFSLLPLQSEAVTVSRWSRIIVQFMASSCSSVEADMCNDPISQSLSVLVDPLRRGKIRYSGVVVGVSPEEVVTEGQWMDLDLGFFGGSGDEPTVEMRFGQSTFWLRTGKAGQIWWLIQSSPVISFRVKVAPLPIWCLLEVRIARALADVVVFHSAQATQEQLHFVGNPNQEATPVVQEVDGLEGQEELCFINNNGSWYKKEPKFQYNNYQQRSYPNNQKSGYQPRYNQQANYQPQQTTPPGFHNKGQQPAQQQPTTYTSTPQNLHSKIDGSYNELNNKFRTLENQFAAMNTQQNRQQGSLPEKSEQNPKETMKAITLRSGKKLPQKALTKDAEKQGEGVAINIDDEVVIVDEKINDEILEKIVEALGKDAAGPKFIDGTYLRIATYFSGMYGKDYVYHYYLQGKPVEVVLPNQRLTSLERPGAISFNLSQEDFLGEHGSLGPIAAPRKRSVPTRHDFTEPPREESVPIYGPPRYYFKPHDGVLPPGALRDAHDHIGRLQRWNKA